MSRYLVLPANASHDVHPENSNNNYKIKLPERLLMQNGSWEVALHAITYPNNWYNVHDSYITLSHLILGYTHKVKVPDGKYKSVQTLVNKCNIAIAAKKLDHIVKLKYRPEDSKVTLTVTENPFFAVKFLGDLGDVLGFNPDRVYGGSDDVTEVA